MAELDGQHQARERLEQEHPEALSRLERLDERIRSTAYKLDIERQALDGVAPAHPRAPKRGRDLDRVRGIDMGIGLGR